MSRINTYPEADSINQDDFLVIDGTTDGTRKFNASLLADNLTNISDFEKSTFKNPITFTKLTGYSNWTFGEAINEASGANKTNDKAARTTYVSFDQPVLIVLDNADYEYVVWVYSIYSISGALYSPIKAYKNKPLIVLPKASDSYFRIGVKRADGAVLTTDYSDTSSDAYKILNSLHTYTQTAQTPDPTLSKSGQAADAKVVGDEINALKGFNAVQLISDHADVQSKTESGLTWSCVNGVFTINGTTASSWFENIYNSRYSVPDWFAEGKRIFIKLNKSGSNIRYIYFRIHIYKQDGTTKLIVDVYDDTVFTVPNIDDAVGIYARVYIASGNVVSGSIRPVISNAPSNLELYDSIEDTNTSVGDLRSEFNSTVAKDTTDLVPRLSNGDTVKNGITFSYLNGKITINGTATSATYFKLCGDINSLPDGITAGSRYFIDIAHSGGEIARIRVECKVDDATSYIYDNDKSTPLLIPSGTTGLAIYIYVYTGGAPNNEKITVSLRRALTNYALSNSVLPSNPGAMFTIIDDDGALGFYTQLLPIIRTKHIPIASAIIGSKIGVSPAYMTWEQVEECFAEGAEILNHTYMHYGETEETRLTNEIRMDYTRNANLMWAHNIPTGDILVYPGGSGNMITAQVAAKQFASAAFRANGNKLNLINQIEPFYIDRYRIDSEYSYDLNQMKGLIDNCIANGGWMVWMIHTSSSYNWNENALSAVSQAIDYAISSGLPIVTARYGIERYIKKRLY